LKEIRKRRRGVFQQADKLKREVFISLLEAKVLKE